MSEQARIEAPGAPGALSNWCNGGKQAVGCALGSSRVWFTVGEGIVNEVYYPRIDIPQIRDLGFIVADGHGFWVEIKTLDTARVEYFTAGAPTVIITHTHPRFTFTQRILPEPHRDVILVEVNLEGDRDLTPFVLLAPHLGGSGKENFGEVLRYRNRRVMWAQQGPFGLALTAVDESQKDAYSQCSVGYSGVSDGWQDFSKNGAMTWRYTYAQAGNIALTGAVKRHSVLALAFASSKEAAATLSISASLQAFATVWNESISQWRHWMAECRLCEDSALASKLGSELYKKIKTSAMVLRTHQDKNFLGAMVASLSVPWGETGEERPGYHLVWPRDLVETAGALLVLGDQSQAQHILRYLIATQLDDGSWYQNQWLGGKPYWTGIQLDQVAFPVLLAGTLADANALDGIEVRDMVQRALGFIARQGPVSPQDRWEEDSGINAFTLSVCIAALVAGARFLAPAEAEFVLELADYWNAHLDEWTAVYNTDLSKRHNIPGYYIRIMPPSAFSDEAAVSRVMQVKNRRHDPGLSAAEQVGVDFLQLVRFGLRTADSPLVADTVRLVDQLLMKELPQGPCWYRYTGDGYGEHEDGSAYDGTGRGRLWPLLTGERGHFELQRGADAVPYLQAMADMASETGMLPEQVWDQAAIPAQGLVLGRPTGSAMPLAWAHAEFIKLAYSILQGYPVDRPEPLWQRYHGKVPPIRTWLWSSHAPLSRIHQPLRLAMYFDVPTKLYWRTNGMAQQFAASEALDLGVHIVRLPKVKEDTTYIAFRYENETSKPEAEIFIKVVNEK